MAELFNKIDEWDKKVSKKIAQKSQKTLKVASFFALSGNMQPWLVISFVFFILDVFMERSDNLIQITLAAAVGLTTTIIKFLTRRIRPNEQVALKYIASGDHYSFPSGHSSRMWSLALFMTLLFPTFGWIFILWAIAVCYGRIALEVHYFVDIAGGAIWGTIVGVVFFLIRNYLYIIFNPISNWFPIIW
jgi:undecaprenyl-diphosphatase